MLRTKACDLAFAIVILAVSFSVLNSAGIYPALPAGHHGKNLSRAGICSLEVPTIDLLSPEDRRGEIPRGNGTKPGFSKIEVCCSGWARKPHSHYECEPICEDGCENGNCTAPNVCVCKRSYFKRQGKCIPTCPVGCLNGVCTNQGICSCNSGHQIDPEGKSCHPVCSGGCGSGGDCVGPETCKCRDGFSLNKGTNKCEFYCEGGCGGGTCIGPNQCSCKPGFKNLGSSCVPECTRGCRNGECTAPNVCTCPHGWNLDKDGATCVPHCSQPCLNADCTAPNVCSCRKGYVEDPLGMNRNKCVAHCPGGCENGQCSAPNFCICNPGFVKESKASQRCIRRVRRSSMHFELIPPQMEQ